MGRSQAPACGRRLLLRPDRTRSSSSALDWNWVGRLMREPEFFRQAFQIWGSSSSSLSWRSGSFGWHRGGAGSARSSGLALRSPGWVGVMSSLIFAPTIWWQASLLSEGYLIERQISRPLDMGRFVLFTCCASISSSYQPSPMSAAFSAFILAREESDSTALGSGGVPAITMWAAVRETLEERRVRRVPRKACVQAE